MTLTDTVGFIQDLPTELVAAFKSTLEESRNVDLLFMSLMPVIPIMKNMKGGLDILKGLDMEDIPCLAIYNKMDVADNWWQPSFLMFASQRGQGEQRNT